VLEAKGIPTVSLSINRPISEKLLAPRAAFVKFPHGASFGEPHNRLQQMTILRDLLLLLQTAEEPGILMDLPYKWRRSTYEEVTWDSFITHHKN
jgi:D-proline reductase (dithiol) PrdB